MLWLRRIPHMYRRLGINISHIRSGDIFVFWDFSKLAKCIQMYVYRCTHTNVLYITINHFPAHFYTNVVNIGQCTLLGYSLILVLSWRLFRYIWDVLKVNNIGHKYCRKYCDRLIILLYINYIIYINYNTSTFFNSQHLGNRGFHLPYCKNFVCQIYWCC